MNWGFGRTGGYKVKGSISLWSPCHFFGDFGGILGILGIYKKGMSFFSVYSENTIWGGVEKPVEIDVVRNKRIDLLFCVKYKIASKNILRLLYHRLSK
jgi:hypothetical protein